MPISRDPAKTFTLTIDKLEVGLSADGLVPATFESVGLVHDTMFKCKADKLVNRDLSGQGIQKNFDASFESGLMQVLDADTLETTYKNKNCWIKATDTGGAKTLTLKNFYINVSADIDASPSGKAVVQLSGQKYCGALADAWAFA